MTFPVTIRDIKVEMYIPPAGWTDITADVYQRDPISITRGTTEWGTTVQPSTCTMQLDNRTGKYSPENPLSPYYGNIGRNTQIRVTTEDVVSDRFWGEIASFAARRDTSGNDAWMVIEAAGILRRLNQGQNPSSTGVATAIRNMLPAAYWPLTDGTSSTTGVGYGTPPAVSDPAVGRFEGYLLSNANFGLGSLGDEYSEVLRVVSTGASGYFEGNATAQMDNNDTVALDFMYKTDTIGSTFSVSLSTRNATLDRAFWQLDFRNDGVNNDITVSLIQDFGVGPVITALGDTGSHAAVTDGLVHLVRLELTNDTGNVDWTLYIDGDSIISGTHNTYEMDLWLLPRLAYVQNTGTPLSVGHVMVWQGANFATASEVAIVVFQFQGEMPDDRIQRLCDENDLPIVITGGTASTNAMGVQPETDLITVLAQAAFTDQGLLYETMDQFGLGYRRGNSLFNQTPALVVDYSLHQLNPPFEPIDDDKNTRNDIFAQRIDGGSEQATKESGPLSILPPPDGVGRYKDEVQISLADDSALQSYAYWFLTLGTIEESRFPQLTIDLANPNVVSAGLGADVLAVGIGDLIQVVNAGNAFFFYTIDLIVLGVNETLNAYEHVLTFNCVPGAPYQSATYGSGVGTGPYRYDTEYSSIDDSVVVGTTTTTLAVATVSPGALWTTTVGEFPFDINVAGERMTVTNITGASSPQTFTVTRSVNGVVKSHVADSPVRMWTTPRYGFQ